MNTKKIWILAIVFGLLTSVIFIIATSDMTKGNQSAVTTTAPPLAEEPDEEAELEAEKDEEVEEEKAQLEIAEGKRAISIPVSEIQSVSGFVRPGSYVDVVAVLPTPINSDSSAQVIINYSKVLAVGTTMEDKVELDEDGNEIESTKEPYYMVTLEVTPTEGATLSFAQEYGVYTLMLRGDGDSKKENVKVTTEQMLKKGKSEQ
ncbi:MAG: Flp pilus assembly protein CpaB [Bacillaceae bacterium]|nr:Flp pilus assembly protein CpaB [Bacillaceae bacterium]